jgi:PAS domain S-box-containing protein
MREIATGTDHAMASANAAPADQAFPASDALPNILDNMLNGVAYCRMLFADGVPQDFIYLYTNPAFHEQTGLGPVCGKRVSEVIPGIRTADPRLFEIYGRVAAGGQPEKFETFVDSLQAWFAVHAYSPCPDHFVAVFDVISQRKQLDSEVRLQALVLDQIQEQVTVTDLAGTVTYVNRAEAEALASPKENRLGRHVSVYGDGPQADATQDEIVEATRRFGAWRGKVVNYRADGSPMLIELSTTLVRDESGKPVAMVGVSTDITERQIAEERLRTSEERYRRLHESLLDAFVLVDMAGHINECNLAYQEMVGYSAEELQDLSYVDLTPAKWHDMEARIVAEQIIPNGHSEVYAKEYIRKDGTVFPVELRTFLIRDKNGQPEAMWAIVRDITEREKVLRQLAQARDDAEKANRAKSRFLAAASHDLRQPILAIDLFQAALGKPELSHEQKQIADYLSQSADSLSGILTELLEISRFDAGGVQACPEPLPAEEIFRQIDTEFSPLAGIKGLRFKFFFPQKGLVLFTDQKMLLNLLRNLIDNAFKYVDTGGVLVAMRRRGSDALIQVWDTGIGIAPEHIEAIFDEYFQIGNPQRDRDKGLGLGLSIVKRLAKALGSQISCRSYLGKGSVFEFRVPLADATTS